MSGGSVGKALDRQHLKFEMIARVVGVDQKEYHGKYTEWRVKLQVDGSPNQAPMVLRIPVSVDRARAWGAMAGQKVKIVLQSMEIA